MRWYVQGSIYTVNMNSHTGSLSRSHRNRSSNNRKSPITTVQYRSFSLLARGPVLLTCTQDGSLSFFRSWLAEIFVWLLGFHYEMLIMLASCSISVALEIQGYLTPRCSLKLTPRVHSIRASFCPLLSLEKGEYIGLWYHCFFFVLSEQWLIKNDFLHYWKRKEF